MGSFIEVFLYYHPPVRECDWTRAIPIKLEGDPLTLSIAFYSQLGYHMSRLAQLQRCWLSIHDNLAYLGILRGGPFDTWGGGLWFFFVIKLFFSTAS